MGEERRVWPSGALEKSCICLSRSPHQWEGKLPLPWLLSVLPGSNPNQNLPQKTGASPCNSGWASATKQTLEGLQNNSVGFWFPAQNLVLYLPRWGPGASLLGWHTWEQGGMTGGSCPVVLKESSDLEFASHGSWWIMPSKVTHQFLWRKEG